MTPRRPIELDRRKLLGFDQTTRPGEPLKLALAAIGGKVGVKLG